MSLNSLRCVNLFIEIVTEADSEGVTQAPSEYSCDRLISRDW